MNNLKDIKFYKIFFILFVIAVGIFFIIIYYIFYKINFVLLVIEASIVVGLFYLILDYTFKEVVKREEKLKKIMKDLFDSYQYIGNVNRQIDIITNLNTYITSINVSTREVASLVVNYCGQLTEADFCTVYFYDESYQHYKKTKIYYCPDRSKMNYFISHLKCDTCTHYMSDNSEILEVDKKSENKCKYFPASFWDKYKMINIPFIYKGQKRGYIMVIVDVKKEITLESHKLLASLATQLGVAVS